MTRTAMGSRPLFWAQQFAYRPLVQRATSAATRRRLRVLAYHAVPDARAFAAQLDAICRAATPVSEDEVLEDHLPDRAVWFTFDDGDPSIVEVAMPLLLERGIRSTMFVCPGVIDTHQPFWWEGFPAPVVRRLKSLPDGQLRCELRNVKSQERRQLTTDQLRSWCAAGMRVGNHTWDHPVLPRCSPDVQRSQIVDAHNWLTEVVGAKSVRAFAYPNGDPSPAARKVLESLSYRVGLLFDHRLVKPGGDPLRMSRLRIDADAPVERATAIVSGAHSGLAAVGRFVRRPEESTAGKPPGA